MWCGFTPLLTSQREICYQKASVKQTFRHTYPPAPHAPALAVSKSSSQQPETAACWASCSPGSMPHGAEPVKPSDSRMSRLSRNSWRHSAVLGCWTQILLEAVKGILWGFMMGRVLQSQKSRRSWPNRWTSLGGGGGHLRKGNRSQHQTCVGLLSNMRLA